VLTVEAPSFAEWFVSRDESQLPATLLALLCQTQRELQLFTLARTAFMFNF